MGKQTDKKPRKVLSINRGKHSPRLFSKGVFIGYTRNLANTKCNNHLLQLEGVQDPEAAKFYLGKRVMYLYSAKKNHAKKSYRYVIHFSFFFFLQSITYTPSNRILFIFTNFRITSTFHVDCPNVSLVSHIPIIPSFLVSLCSAIWGKICRAHGNSGLVRAKFRVNLPGQALGRPVRVMLYPSNV